MSKKWTWLSGIVGAIGVAVTAHPDLAQAVTVAYPKAAPLIAVIGILGAMFGPAAHGASDAPAPAASVTP